ncbi:MAG: lysozyme [Patescibacteria group bacterium]|nr:lysozyme [Patescibacteria group bacterium]
MADISWDLLKEELIRDEGRSATLYRDSLGYLTGGVGRLLDPRLGGRFRENEIDLMLSNDVNIAYVQNRGKLWFEAADTDARRRAFLNMRFQLGNRLDRFENTLAAAARQDWTDVGRRLRQSRWHQETPERADRIIRMLETGS